MLVTHLAVRAAIAEGSVEDKARYVAFVLGDVDQDFGNAGVGVKSAADDAAPAGRAGNCACYRAVVAIVDFDTQRHAIRVIGTHVAGPYADQGVCLRIGQGC